MSADDVSRIERVLNLLALLLDTKVPLTRDALLREVGGYPESDQAARRAFERDKEALRAMGVPIRNVTLADGVEIGYEVVASEYYLPDLGLEADESAALRMAMSAVALDPSGDGRTNQAALWKLGAGATEQMPPIVALPAAPELATIFDAARRRCVVEFGYRGERRRVEPWALRSARGQWYVIARDLDREARRTFRADRIEGPVKLGEPGTFTVPPDFDPSEALTERAWEIGGGERRRVVIAFDPPHQLGALAQLDDPGPPFTRDDGRVEVAFDAVNLAAARTFALGFLDHAEVLEPPELRADIVGWLEALT